MSEKTKAQPSANTVVVAKPTIGRTVHYILTKKDVAAIKERRNSPIATAYIADGSAAKEGDHVAAVVTKSDHDAPGVNLQAFLDGNDALWVKHAEEGTEPGAWHWPERE